MGRAFQIFGETLVKVKGNNQTSIASVSELGLASGMITIVPRFYHQDVHSSDFGPNAPPEVIWNLADVAISMTLVHYDQDILDEVISESMCGAVDGTLINGAGQPMGGAWPVLTFPCHFMHLNLINGPALIKPWRFLAAYLTGMPVSLPLGTEKSAVSLNWRAIPYWPGSITPMKPGVLDLSQEMLSQNQIIWDRRSDD